MGQAECKRQASVVVKKAPVLIDRYHLVSHVEYVRPTAMTAPSRPRQPAEPQGQRRTTVALSVKSELAEQGGARRWRENPQVSLEKAW